MFKFSMKSCLVFILPTICALQGCQSTYKSESKQDTELKQTQATPPQIEYQATPGLSLQERFSKALRDLENGRSEQALAELKEYNKKRPNFARVVNLINQITTPSSQYFTSENFTINLASGQSLSTLAAKYLGSAFEFYALAKYNGIENPSKVLIGQDIKIPLTQLAKSKRNSELEKKTETKQSETPPSDVPVEATLKEENINEQIVEQSEEENLISDEEIAQEVEAFEQNNNEVVDDVFNPQTIISTLSELVLLGDFEQAETLASDALNENPQLVDFDSFNTLLPKIKEGRAYQLIDIDPERASDLLIEYADLKSDSLSDLELFFTQRKALNLNQGNDQLSQIVLNKKEELAELYHRTASTAYQKQDLDTAIENWKTVLEIDPEHQNANVFLTNAENLKKRLESLKD